MKKKCSSFRQKIVFLCLIITIIWSLSDENLNIINANPLIPFTRFDDLCTGPRYNESLPVKFVSANITINCYDTVSKGTGIYILENVENETIIYPIWFFSGFEILSGEVTANGTNLPYEYTERIFYSEEYGNYSMHVQEFLLDFSSNSYINLGIEWNFTSGIIQGLGHRIFHTGYAVNGGEFWGEQAIEWEHVRFNFHTSNFFISSSSIKVNIRNDSKYCQLHWSWDNFNWTEMFNSATVVPLQTDQHGIPYYEFYAENIVESYNIHIVNGMPSSSSFFSPAYNQMVWSIIIMVVAGISIIITIMFIRKYWKRRRN